MQDKIQELYELAGIKRSEYYLVYPPFTAEKQLELIKWIGSEYETIEITWYSDTGFRIVSYNHLQDNSDFSQALAGLVCELWEELTPEQREEVRGILR